MDSKHTPRLVPTGRESKCLLCDRWVREDEDTAGVGPGRFDWSDDGDYGCDASPLSDEDASGGHLVGEQLPLILRRAAAVQGLLAVLRFIDERCMIYGPHDRAREMIRAAISKANAAE